MMDVPIPRSSTSSNNHSAGAAARIVRRVPPVWIAVAVLSISTLILYWGATDAPFIADDNASIVTNASIVHLWPLLDTADQRGPLRPPAPLPTAGRPLVNLSFALNYYLGGLEPSGYYQARNSLGLALAKSGKAPQAIAQFDNAPKLNPNYANAHSNLADVLIGTGDVKNAITHYHRAIEIRPDFAEAQYKLAVALTHSGRRDQAIAHYQAAIRVNPNDLQPYASLAQTLALLHRSQEAIETAKKGIDLASAAKQQDELMQFETWLKDYRAQLNQAAASSSPPPAEQPK